jgi:hypothetical protein
LIRAALAHVARGGPGGPLNGRARRAVGAALDAIGSTGKSQGLRLVALYGCMYYGMLRPVVLLKLGYQV